MPGLVLALYLATLAVRHTLGWLNLRHLKRRGLRPPPGLEGEVPPEMLRQAVAYALDRARVDVPESLVHSAFVVVFLFSGWLQAYDRWVGSLTASFIGGGVAFFLGLHLAQTAAGIPFDLFRTFRVEARHGFNTTSPRLWVADLLKSEAIGLCLLAAAAACALGLVRWSPDRWWVWVWGFFAVFTVFLLYLSPYLIEPLFFRFEPVRTEGIEEEIRALMARAGLSVSRVFQVDASRRSRHSNAYFTGIGRVKRIVLFDTLLQQMTRPQILAVLAHEAGHWKKKHVLKRIAATQAGAFAALWVAHRVLAWEGLPGLVGLDQASFPARVVLVSFLGAIALFPLTPAASWLSRRHERQADRFACELGQDPESLAAALVILAKENLANLHPHPLYAWFYYSHPPLPARVAELRSL